MLLRIGIVFGVAVVCLLPNVSAAQTPDTRRVSYSPALVEGDVLPSALAAYHSSTDAARATSVAGGKPVIDSGARVLRKPGAPRYSLAFQTSSDPASGERSYLPVLYSALFPGTGEISMGYWKRGVSLMALEVIAWTGYFTQRDKGLQSRDDYERFADENWSTSDWIDFHPEVYPALTGVITTPAEMDSIGRTISGNQTWPGYIPWVSREEDKQHYYENIGKYDWFISGWADYDPDAPIQMMDTALRDQYRAMRIKSNDELDNASRWVYLSLATRAFSIVQTLILVKRDPSPDEQANLDNHFMLTSRTNSPTSGEVALEYWFK